MKSKTIITALVTLVPIIAGGIAIYAFVTGNHTLTEKGFKGGEYFHSPWLGIELFQGDAQVGMLSQGSYIDVFRAKMDTKPFKLLIPKRTQDDVVKICMSTDESIFKAARKGLKTDEVPCLRSGTGIAGAEFSLPILYIDSEAHNHFRNERLEKYSDDKHSISISKFVLGENEYPISEQEEWLYMLVFMDMNKNRIIDNNELEHFTLEF